MIDIPVYVVNLERKPILKRGFKDNNSFLSDIRFTKAFDGSKETVPAHKQETNGRYGCYMSHINIWNKIKNGNDEWALVAEDDGAFNPKLEEDLPRIMDLMKQNKSNIGILHWRKPPFDIPVPEAGNSEAIQVVPVDDFFYGTHAYIISKNGAKASLAIHDATEGTPIDVAMGKFSKSGQIPAHFILSPYEYSRIWVKNQKSSTEERSTGSKTNSNIYIILGVVAAVLLLLILIIFFIKKKKQNKRY
jgi:LPXTG-motif cell wall-anchored protein